MKKTLFGNYKAADVDQHIASLKDDFQKELSEKEKEIAQLTEKCALHDKQIMEIGEAIVYAKSFIVQSKQKLEEEERVIREQIHANHQLLKTSIQAEIDQLIQKRSEIEKEYLEFQLLVQKNVSQFSTMLTAAPSREPQPVEDQLQPFSKQGQFKIL